ncbi:hypothetical protein EXIGLDRAFT_670061 [Exidia glandulosa HHB12029]|uniref:Uncharacterized protein n=1 Tax=Exidia glandulosa HHB12029 TaxID=1314781 RepID=A0A165L8X6_EXIGL|nr:hypothetical protein EXIGLDRAFT_670061 [Exidia glandulosa HHB12029]
MPAPDSLDYVPYDGEVSMDEVEFPHPFYGWREEDDGEIPRTLVELRMCALSAALRAKPEWWRKCTDPDIRARWIQEALEQDNDMTPERVNYVLDELEGYSSLRDEKTGIEVACCDKIWQSDTLVPDALRDALKQGTKVLEDVPDEQKDWHPRSNGFVLDLVHPSLYPLVYGRTMVHWNFKTRGEALRYGFENDHPGVWDQLWHPREWRANLPRDPKKWQTDHLLHWLFKTREEDVDNETWRAKAETAFENIDRGKSKSLTLALDPRFLRRGLKVAKAPPAGSSVISERFAWLPTNFVVGACGVKMLGYINNIHPSNTTLLNAVESIVGAFVPLFERVLMDLLPENAIPLRLPDDYTHGEDDEPPEQLSDESDTEFEDRYNAWHAERPLILPDLPAYSGAIEKRPQQYSLRGREIQVIVKLASIILTPENAEYPGGSWHVEGMKNERIVASGIYYYDEENIGESRLAFRTAVRAPENYEQSDYAGAEKVWGLEHEGLLVQNLGSLETKGGRCIAFPNIFQHCVAPFSLVDKTKPGHRKILALFLVDPNVQIPSTSTVAPQQKDLLVETLESCGGHNHMAKLPTELLQLIVEKDTHTMTRAEAFAYREELMDERTRFVKQQAEEGEGFFGTTFNMCEH